MHCFLLDVSSKAVCIQKMCPQSELQAVQLLIGGGSIINKQKHPGLDGVPCKTCFSSGVSCLDVALRSFRWQQQRKSNVPFFWLQVRPWEWQTRTLMLMLS